MWSLIIIATIIGLLAIRSIVSMLNLSGDKHANLLYLFSGTYILIIIFGTISYILANKDYEKKHGKSLSFYEFINAGKIDNNFFKRVMVGIGTGIVFGILDNSGLWFGMHALDPILPNGPLTRAGYGNVFSDTVSAFLATFAGNIISNVTKVTEDTPIWADAVGTFIGCLIGLYGSRFITGRT